MIAPGTDGKDAVAILLVDDRREDLLALRSLLDAPDYDLVTATSGEEALRHALARDFAVILIDVVMPGMDGFEVASLIKQRDRSRHTPIIFLTAAIADVSYIYRAYSAGAVDYLTKPIDRGVVRAKVGTFVELFRKNRRIREQAAALLEADRKTKELELARLKVEGERRYRNLAEAIPQIVWTANVEGSVTYGNQRWCDYTGHSFAELRGWGWLQSIHADDAPECETRWRETLRSGAVYEQELRMRRRDGAYRWHICRAVPERADDGGVTAWLGTYTDCEDLKQAIHSRDEFLLVASHELRTPLSVLQLQLQSLQRSIDGLGPRDTADRVVAKLGTAVRQTGRLHRLVESLLDVARITAGRLTLEPEEIDLARLARDVVERFGDDASRAGCSLQVDADVPVVGCWDRLRVEQVLTNLVSNAIKYAPGQPIEITVAMDTKKATLTVSDHGIGIESESLARIFGRFERAVPSQHYGGLGMGLYITREIVEAHGGLVRAISEPGRGATFTVELPCEGAGHAAVAAVSEVHMGAG